MKYALISSALAFVGCVLRRMPRLTRLDFSLADHKGLGVFFFQVQTQRGTSFDLMHGNACISMENTAITAE